MRLSDAAFRALVEMILYARRYSTDGAIPAEFLKKFRKKTVKELQENDSKNPSLSEEKNGVFLLHDYLDYQESNREISARLQRNRANGARGGRPKNTTKLKTDSVTDSVTDRATQKKAETETETEINKKATNVAKKARPHAARAQRLNADFSITPEMRAWATAKGLMIDIDAETEKFMNYWSAQPGARGVKLDWQATWRNWMLRANENAEERAARLQTWQQRKTGTQFIAESVQRLNAQQQPALIENTQFIERGKL